MSAFAQSSVFSTPAIFCSCSAPPALATATCHSPTVTAVLGYPHCCMLMCGRPAAKPPPRWPLAAAWAGPLPGLASCALLGHWPCPALSPGYLVCSAPVLVLFLACLQPGEPGEPRADLNNFVRRVEASYLLSAILWFWPWKRRRTTPSWPVLPAAATEK